ncbi:hypothetical protein ACIRLA_46365 [Streptomyces sp. NPDC102364]|uniref:hypothetical protein n=1 Tax=Streptomyces sp. NPDC102364 TaxID=3366161 RepID=UPI003819BC2F
MRACGPVLVRGPKGDKGDPGPPADLTGVESAWADTSADADVMFLNKSTGGESIMQSLAVDSMTRDVYLTQVIPDGVQLDDEPAPVSFDDRSAAGDILITRVTMTGTPLDHMYLRGVGHPVGLGIDARPGADPWLWIGTDAQSATGNYSSSAIGYIAWNPSEATALDNADITTRMMPTGEPADWSYVNIDPTTRRLVHCEHLGDYTWHFYLYDLDDAYEDRWEPIADLTARFPGLRFQGLAAAGRYLYVWTGHDLGTHPEGNAVMYRYDFHTGQLVEAVLVDDLMDGEVARREAEGVTVWLPDPAYPDTWTLSAGFACTQSGRWVQTVISWPVPALAATGPVTVDWTDLPLADGFEAYSSSTVPQYTVLEGGVAQLRGMVKYTDGTTFGDEDAAVASYARFCTDLPDALMADGTSSRWQRRPIGGEYSRVYVLEIDGVNGLMNAAWPQGGGGARWVDISATIAVRRGN